MEQRTCSFCGHPIEPGTGKMFIRRDGTVHFFDRARCQMDLLTLGRHPRKLKWTKHYPRGGGEKAEARLAKEQAKAALEAAEPEEAEEPEEAAPKPKPAAKTVAKPKTAKAA